MTEETMQWNIRDKRELEETGAVVMDGWELKKLLGQGGCGSVWLAEKSLFGIKDQAAIKIISIPNEAGAVDVMRSEGFSGEEIQTELRRQVENAVREIRIMIKLKNHPSTVLCESFDVIQYEEDDTWDIFIRMELLKSLIDWTKDKAIETKDVVRLGVSLADLLTECEKQNILHRDIKPNNIFVDENNQFKLGDFGLSRVISDANSVHSKGVGTEAFMAPEVFRGEHYDHRADIYSLGLVMYWLLNEKRLPFVNNGVSRSEAVSMRLSGKELPELPGIDSELNQIIQKACDPDPNKRWILAKDLAEALKRAKQPNTFTNITIQDESKKTSEPKDAPPKESVKRQTRNNTAVSSPNTPATKKKAPLIIGLVLGALLIIGGVLVFGGGIKSIPTNESISTTKITVTESETTPTKGPTAEPTAAPSKESTAEPTAVPTKEPTAEPTAAPTKEPTPEPTAKPTQRPTNTPEPDNHISEEYRDANVTEEAISVSEESTFPKQEIVALSKTKILQGMKAGEIVQYGTYEKEPIEWVVTDVVEENNTITVTLLSRWIIDYSRYHDRFSRTSWEKCAIHEWLNNDFRKNLLDEATEIALVEENIEGKTSDQVWLLSEEEYRGLSDAVKQEIKGETEYAERWCSIINTSTSGNTIDGWWLRDSGTKASLAKYVAGTIGDVKETEVEKAGGVRSVIKIRISK